MDSSDPGGPWDPAPDGPLAKPCPGVAPVLALCFLNLVPVSDPDGCLAIRIALRFSEAPGFSACSPFLGGKSLLPYKTGVGFDIEKKGEGLQ